MFRSTAQLFRPRLEDLRFRASNGTELDIPLFPDDHTLRPYLDSQNRKALPALAEDRPFWESGHLKFRATCKYFSISPDVKNPRVSKEHPLLKRCRILNGKKWTGTIFLNPDCSGNYSDISGPCEFIVLTSFKAYNHKIATSYLEGLLDMSVEEKEPAIFPAAYYQEGHASHKQQVESWWWRHSTIGRMHAPNTCPCCSMALERWGDQELDRYGGMPHPANFDSSHVMWIEQKGDVVYRKAIGIVGGDLSSRESHEEFCLG
jgi:hypothetical protein